MNQDYDSVKFCNSLEIFDLAVSLGGVESLVCHPATMTHESYSPELQEEIGIKNELLRFAVGIEAAEDLMQILNRRLKKHADNYWQSRLLMERMHK